MICGPQVAVGSLECVPEWFIYRSEVTDMQIDVNPDLLGVLAAFDEVLGPGGVVILSQTVLKVCLFDHALFNCARDKYRKFQWADKEAWQAYS